MNNLKDVSIELPKRRLTVFTGVSGSGKSSLVFGTIAAESQRLINETYSAFVQGFMPTLARPDVDVLEGLTTAIIVDQERMGADARSTVGTATEPRGAAHPVQPAGPAEHRPPHAFSFNTPTRRGERRDDGRQETRASRNEERSRRRTGGMCPRCEGRGSVTDFDLTQMYDDSKSLNEGALTIPGYSMDGWYGRIFRGLRLLRPGQADRQVHQEGVRRPALQGADQDQGRGHQPDVRGPDPEDPEVVPLQGRRRVQPHIRAFVERVVTFTDCPDCGGSRLNEAARSSRIDGVNIADACAMQISDLAEWVRASTSRRWPRCSRPATPSTPSPEIGLGYLSLDRPTGTLSGREAQRTKMIRHLGSSLTDVTYVFDEPTVGLHPHDIARMNETLLQLRDKGNTVLVVEHKPETIAVADHAVDLGPGAGTAAATCVRGHHRGAPGSDTSTGRHLDDRAGLKESVRSPTGTLEVRGASTNNLQGVDVDIPLGVLSWSRRGRIRQELADPRLGVRPRRGRVRRPGALIRGSRRSNPATYTGLLDPIRKAFAKANGVKPALFSSNSEGACPNCNGAGVVYTDLGDDGRRRQASARSARGSGSRPTCSSTSSAARTSARCSRCGWRGDRVLRRRRGQVPAAQKISIGSPTSGSATSPRAAAPHAVRRRAAAAQARHAHGREGRRLCPR